MYQHHMESLENIKKYFEDKEEVTAVILAVLWQRAVNVLIQT